jgi:hypothetical protein
MIPAHHLPRGLQRGLRFEPTLRQPAHHPTSKPQGEKICYHQSNLAMYSHLSQALPLPQNHHGAAFHREDAPPSLPLLASPRLLQWGAHKCGTSLFYAPDARATSSTLLEGCPLRAANYQRMVGRGRGVERRVKFEEWIGSGPIITPMQHFEYGDDVSIAHDGVGEPEHDLELEWRDVLEHGDPLERVQEAEVPLGGHFGCRGDALVDHVERDVGEVVVFEQIVGRAGEGAYEDRVVLRRDESDGGKTQVHLPGHFLSLVRISRR